MSPRLDHAGGTFWKSGTGELSLEVILVVSDPMCSFLYFFLISFFFLKKHNASLTRTEELEFLSPCILAAGDLFIDCRHALWSSRDFGGN